MYVFEPGTFKPLAFVQRGEINHYHLDHLGTPQEITNANGELVWTAQYKAYGSLALAAVQQVENNLRFQGQYYDEESGLHYNRHRYYDPECGRFINQDPIGLLGGHNNYRYAPNPIIWIDPLGLSVKPLNSPAPDRWVENGGTVWNELDGTWVYQNSSGDIVRYPNGYPDFSPYVVQEVNVPNLTGNHSRGPSGDFGKADALSDIGPANYRDNTWHHHENGVTMQEIPKSIHGEFTHRGGVSNIKKNGCSKENL